MTGAAVAGVAGCLGGNGDDKGPVKVGEREHEGRLEEQFYVDKEAMEGESYHAYQDPELFDHDESEHPIRVAYTLEVTEADENTRGEAGLIPYDRLDVFRRGREHHDPFIKALHVYDVRKGEPAGARATVPPDRYAFIVDNTGVGESWPPGENKVIKEPGGNDGYSYRLSLEVWQVPGADTA